MRTAARASPRQPPPRLPPRLLLRETVRIAAAFGLYVVLHAVWTRTGLGELYGSLVMGLAERIFVPNQHFPVLQDLAGVRPTRLDFVVVFAICLFLVSTGMPWRRRLARFGVVLAVVYVLHVITLVLQVKLIAAEDMNERFGLLLMLPAEFTVTERVKYLLYDLGLQWGPFVLALLAVFWNSQDAHGPDRRRTIGSKRLLVVGAATVATLLVLGLGWSRWRESRPLHVQAHATLGRMLHQQGNEDEAARHYRIAVDSRVDAPGAYYYLALIESRSGRSREAIDLLLQGKALGADPEWTPRFDKALAEMGGARPPATPP